MAGEVTWANLSEREQEVLAKAGRLGRRGLVLNVPATRWLTDKGLLRRGETVRTHRWRNTHGLSRFADVTHWITDLGREVLAQREEVPR
jgi:hypothetical protein